MPSCLLLQRPTRWVQGKMLLSLLTSTCQLQMDKKEHAQEVPAKRLTPFPMFVSRDWKPQDSGGPNTTGRATHTGYDCVLGVNSSLPGPWEPLGLNRHKNGQRA